jgi:hypothetical protein
MAVIGGTRDIKVYRGEYSFAVDGGAISTIPLRGSAGSQGPIPSGSVILEAFLDVTTGFTTGSAATAALTVEAANDLVSATLVSGAPYSTTGLKATLPVFTAATMIKLTADRTPSIVIATGTITAGVLALVIFYV